MPADYGEYYRQLLDIIEHCQHSSGPEMEKIEDCFKHSLDYWGKVREGVKENGFDSIAGEIRFFKEVKPLFTGLIEYYTRRYHALLFLPTDDKAEQGRFWQWELRKIERFFENNAAFCVYMQEGETDKDEKYFLRSANTEAHHTKSYDSDADISTSRDSVLAMMIAYGLYRDYIEAEAQKLEGYFFLAK
ncbi:MAG TPA: RteC domain-containing protein [Puia sp.]|nr:RteC domain-containing protein [Puia sp.]